MAGTDPYIIDWNQPCTIPWFRLYMRLPGKGLVPTVVPDDVMPSRDAVAHFFGPRSSQGYTFDSHGNQAYEDYVRDLFTRVLQLKWPSTSVIPFHFARALVAEACDLEVNWAEFAFKQTHPRCNPPDTPRLLSVFNDLSDPLPALRKVIPVSDIKEVAYARPAGDTISPVIKKEISPTTVTPPVAHTRGSPSTRPDEGVRTGFIFPTTPAPVSAGIGRNYGYTPMDPGARKGLLQLKDKLATMADAEQVRVRTARHQAFEPVADMAERLLQEKEKLKHVLRKTTEKQGSYDRAVKEYSKSRAVLVGAHNEADPNLNQDLNIGNKSFQNACETLVNSVKGNLDFAKKRVAAWDFKCKRQFAMLSKAQKDLAAAEAKYAAECMAFDTEIKNLHALQSFLLHL